MFFGRKSKASEFTIDNPALTVTPNAAALFSALKASGIKYTRVCKGYVTFEGKAFHSDISLVFGIHYGLSRVSYIEIFRPREYYQASDYDIDASFNELSEALKREYGKPLLVHCAKLYEQPNEQWLTPNYAINHYIMDRFGPEEHLNINFYKTAAER